MIAAGAVIAAGCGSSNQPTAPTETPVLSTETFTGTVQPAGKDSKAFTVTYSSDYSDASITLTALTNASGAAVQTTMGLAFGTIAFDTSCTPAAQLTAPTAAIGQELRTPAVFYSGKYCVSIFDAGTVTEPLNYSITVKHY